MKAKIKTEVGKKLEIEPYRTPQVPPDFARDQLLIAIKELVKALTGVVNLATKLIEKETNDNE